MQAQEKSNGAQVVQKVSSVLLIDDEPGILTILKRSLELAGMNTYGFTNPVLAVEHFRNNANSYDIVVIDIRMPHMNGFQVARAVKEIKPDIKIAFATSFEINNKEFKRILPSTKVDAFITKPVKPDKFAEIVNGVMVNQS
ncbi:MAG TPA: response regulator [Nitrososphaera sp.]|nr:response regulator [Nitrososphaera sp.]